MLDLGFFANLETYGLIAIALVSLLLYVVGGQFLLALFKGLDLDAGVSLILSLVLITFITVFVFSVLETVILSWWFWLLFIVGLVVLVAVKKLLIFW